MEVKNIFKELKSDQPASTRQAEFFHSLQQAIAVSGNYLATLFSLNKQNKIK